MGASFNQSLLSDQHHISDPNQAEERQSIEELDQGAFDVLDPALIRYVLMGPHTKWVKNMHNAHVKNLAHGRPSFEDILMKMTLTIGCKNYMIAIMIHFLHFSFSLSPPLPAVPEMTPQFVCETASRSHNHHDNQNHHHYCNNHRHYTITTIIIFSDCCSCLSIGLADFPSSGLFLIPHRLQTYRPIMK